LDEFHAALDSLHKYTFAADWDKASPVVLGFGLLLRDCWRAVEVEGDDEDAPMFLRESLLGSKHVDQVVKVIKEVIVRLPSPDANANVERLKDKELDDSAKGEKAKVGHKKHVASTRAPSPGVQSRSRRERKPSKKLLGDS
jgi:hypothetical protein